MRNEIKSFKHIKNYIEGESATMLIYKSIGDSIDDDGNIVSGANGAEFAQEMLFCEKVLGVKNIDVRINSGGGGVVEGWSFVAAILNSKCTVNTFVDGMAASMAGVIAVSGKKCCIMSHGTMMLHNPTDRDGNDSDPVLKVIKNQISTLFQNRTGLPKEEIDKMMDKETWLTANEAKEKGFADEIINTGKKIKQIKDAAKMADIYNSILNTKEKKMKSLKKILNLSETSTDERAEEKAVETIEDLQTKNEALKKENEEKGAKILELEKKIADDKAAAEASANSAAEKAVDTFIASGKGKAEDKADMLELAKTNLSAFNKIIGTNTDNKAAKIFDSTKLTAANAGRENWTFSDYEKKDPEALRIMQTENKVLFDELLKNHKPKK